MIRSDPYGQRGWVRLHKLPRRYWRIEAPGSLFDKLTIEPPRARYIREQSEARYRRRPDAYVAPLLCGEVGRCEGFRIIISELRDEVEIPD